MTRRGSYVLLIRLERPALIEVGRLGPVHFEDGAYAYVGSAMGGLDARIARHLRAEKRMHWHIDYLLAAATVDRVLEFESARRIECELSDALAGLGRTSVPAAGFGASDCRCRAHLFYLGASADATVATAREIGEGAHRTGVMLLEREIHVVSGGGR